MLKSFFLSSLFPYLSHALWNTAPENDITFTFQWLNLSSGFSYIFPYIFPSSLLLLSGEPAHHMDKTSFSCRLFQTVHSQFYVCVISHGNSRNCTSLRSITCCWLWLKMTEQWKNIKEVLIGWHTSWQRSGFYFCNTGLVPSSVDKEY